jgi:POT family proton-dependent oligopeptide transporter
LRRYILIAVSEIFASITGLEYAFTKAPKNMRSLVMSVFLFMTAISSALGEAFVCKSHAYRIFFHRLTFSIFFCSALSADPLLVWNYGSMGVLAAIAGILFWLSVRKLDAQEDRLNQLAEGHLDDARL